MEENKQLAQRPAGTTTHFSEWDVIRHQAKVLVESQFLPKAIDTWQKATAVIMYGKELGIGPMEACQSIDVIQGKPTQKPQSMKAMVHKKLPGAIFRPVRSNDTEAVYEAARPGDEPKEFSFTWKDAEKLGLTVKDNWKKQPKVMLSWRCIGHVCRTVFPDCLSGISYTPEEMGAEVDDDHNVINVQATSEKYASPTTLVESNPVDEKKLLGLSDFNEAAEKKKAVEAFNKKLIALRDTGFKDPEILKQLNVPGYNDIVLKDSKTIYAALEVLHDAT